MVELIDGKIYSPLVMNAMQRYVTDYINAIKLSSWFWNLNKIHLLWFRLEGVPVMAPPVYITLAHFTDDHFFLILFNQP